MQRQLRIKIRELDARQRRLDALSEAAQKLDVVRTLMRTRGAHAVPKKQQMQDIKDAIGKRGAQLTAKGLAVEDDRDDEDTDMHARSKTKFYKWSNERKK